MEIAHIVPTNYLEPLRNTFQTNFYMVLAHQILKDDKYLQFFQERKNEGAFIILDNSAFEFGNAIDDRFLLKAISLISPSEFILPDVLFDKEKTKERVNNFLKKNLDEEINFMAVPQGNNIDEWIESYLFVRIDKNNGVGVFCKQENLNLTVIYNLENISNNRQNLMNGIISLLRLVILGILKSVLLRMFVHQVLTIVQLLFMVKGFLFNRKRDIKSREKINFNQNFPYKFRKSNIILGY